MEKEEEVIENITLKDPYDLNIDPFDLSDLQKESDVVDEVVREEEFTVDDVNEEPVEDSSQIPTNEVIEQEEQQNSTEESFDIEVGKGMLRFLAQKKGLDSRINFDAIESTEDLEEILDSFEDFDQVVAVENLKQSNETIAKITDFILKGGKEEDIVNYLTQSKEINSINITEESGAKQLIKDYYKKVVKFSDEVIDKKLKKLEDSDSLLSEAEDLQPLYSEYLNKEIEAKTKEAEENKKLEVIRLQQRQTQFVNQLQANKYSREVAGELYNTAFKEVVLNTGEKKILLDAKIEMLKQKPETFLKLVSFINNPDHYDKQILANKGSEIVQNVAKNRLIINSKPKEATSVQKSENKLFQLKFK